MAAKVNSLRSNLVNLAGRSLGVLEVLPTVLRVKNLLRWEKDLHRILSELDSSTATAKPLSKAQLETLEAHVNRALMLLGQRERACVPRSMTLYALLSRSGHKLTFLSGVRRHAGQLDGHAWLEINGEALDHERLSGEVFTVQFRHHNNAARQEQSSH